MLESVETEVEEWSTVGRHKTRGEGVERGKAGIGERAADGAVFLFVCLFFFFNQKEKIKRRNIVISWLALSVFVVR